MSRQALGGSAFDRDSPERRADTVRRIRWLVALLIASTFVPTMIAVIAGMASLEQPRPSQPRLLVGPPTYPIVIDGIPGEEPSSAGSPVPSPSGKTGDRQPARGGKKATGKSPVREGTPIGPDPGAVPGCARPADPASCPGNPGSPGAPLASGSSSASASPSGSADPSAGPHASPSPSTSRPASTDR